MTLLMTRDILWITIFVSRNGSFGFGFFTALSKGAFL